MLLLVVLSRILSGIHRWSDDSHYGNSSSSKKRNGKEAFESMTLQGALVSLES